MPVTSPPGEPKSMPVMSPVALCFKKWDPRGCDWHRLGPLTEQTIARKFGAKASFEAWSTAFYVKFREESEFEVKSGPKLNKNFELSNFRKKSKL